MPCDVIETRGRVRLVRINGSQPYWLVDVQGEGDEDRQAACDPCSERAARERFDLVCGLVERGGDA